MYLQNLTATNNSANNNNNIPANISAICNETSLNSTIIKNTTNVNDKPTTTTYGVNPDDLINFRFCPSTSIGVDVWLGFIMRDSNETTAQVFWPKPIPYIDDMLEFTIESDKKPGFSFYFIFFFLFFVFILFLVVCRNCKKKKRTHAYTHTHTNLI